MEAVESVNKCCLALVNACDLFQNRRLKWVYCRHLLQQMSLFAHDTGCCAAVVSVQLIVQLSSST
jgi:hypothetical protein